MGKLLKILIEMKHGLGDCIMALPAIRAIRDTYPDAHITLLVNSEANKAIFEHSGIRINDYLYFSLKNRPVSYTLKNIFKLMSRRYDIGILALQSPVKKGRIFFSMLGIKHVYGEQYLPQNVVSKYNNHIHFVDRQLKVVEPIVKSIDDRTPVLFPDDNLVKRYQYLKNGRPLLAVNIGGGDKNYFNGNYVFTRSWKSGNMKELVDRLSQNDVDIILLGGKLEEEELPAYGNLLKKENIFNFVGATTIAESIAILSLCDLSVGVDTGMQHVAGALNTKTLSIFGPTTPCSSGCSYAENAQFLYEQIRCSPCYGSQEYYTCKNRVCLDSISPEIVEQKIVDILELSKNI